MKRILARMSAIVISAARWLVWLLDEVLDRVPAYEDGKWHRFGDWGCRLELAKFWWPEAYVREDKP